MSIKSLLRIGVLAGLAFLLIAVASSLNQVKESPVEATGCFVEFFDANPPSPVTTGTHVELHAKGDCSGGIRAVKFQINGVDRVELGSHELTEIWPTEEFGPGTYNICFLVAGGSDGSWEAGTQECKTYEVTGSAPPPPSECSVEFFNAYPASPVSVGTDVELHGKGSCNGGVRAVKFQINGVDRVELGAPELTETWRTGEFGVGTYNVCFLVAGGSDSSWEASTQECKAYEVMDVAPPPPPPPSNCSVEFFETIPVSPVSVGTEVLLHGKGKCDGGVRAVKFQINGQDRNEIGAPEQTEVWRTGEFGTGTYYVCFHVAGGSDSSWGAGTYECKTYQVLENVPPPSDDNDIPRAGDLNPDNGCSIRSFDMAPASNNYSPGTHVTLSGTSDCGTVRFEIRNVETSQFWIKAEIGSTAQTETWKTEEFPIGPYQVCFVARGNGGWDGANHSCKAVGIGTTFRDEPDAPDNPDNSNADCPASPSQLSVGDIAVVSVGSLYARSQPGFDSAPLFSLFHGELVSIVSGPVCNDGYRWWEIGRNGQGGWSAEVGSGGYYLVPNGTPIPDDEPPSDLPPSDTNPGDGEDPDTGGNNPDEEDDGGDTGETPDESESSSDAEWCPHNVHVYDDWQAPILQLDKGYWMLLPEGAWDGNADHIQILFFQTELASWRSVPNWVVTPNPDTVIEATEENREQYGNATPGRYYQFGVSTRWTVLFPEWRADGLWKVETVCNQ